MDEVNKHKTDPHDEDSDDDGIKDSVEVQNGTNPILNDAKDDADSDGITNIDEIEKYGTDPLNADSD
ncbi:MAG: hypothetical protein LBC41_07450, partial [Clostridiales bacterium]|nr:hypothetical protein [Clostridiales bacterium]